MTDVFVKGDRAKVVGKPIGNEQFYGKVGRVQMVYGESVYLHFPQMKGSGIEATRFDREDLRNVTPRRQSSDPRERTLGEVIRDNRRKPKKRKRRM